jgi:ABC-type glycerol-3-phosphate transport system permease component
MTQSGSPLVRFLVLVLFCAIWVLPLVYILAVALRPPLVNGVPVATPLGLSLDNYAAVFANKELLRALLNSAIIGIVSTLLILVIAVPAAFVCATREFAGRAEIEAWILSTRMMPAFVVVLPYFLFFRTVHLNDTLTGLIIMHVVVSLALAFFMLRSFFAELPREILEAATMEGAGQFRVLFSVALPQVRSGLIATGIMVFIFSWNELAFAFTLAGGAVKTGPVAILSFMAFQSVQIAPLMAAASVLIAPIAILLIVAQKGLIRGLSFGAIRN